MADPRPTPTEAAYVEDRAALADADELIDFYRHLAESEFDGYCPLYAQLARGIAADPALVHEISSLGPPAKIVPVLLFAAVHDQVLADPSLPLAAHYRGDPDPPEDAVACFRRHVLDHRTQLADTVQHRSIQTNEVGRSSFLVAALTALHRRHQRPLGLVEIGPSAGLNLLGDRYRYHFERSSSDPVRDRFAAGVDLGTDSVVQLDCEVRGPLAPPLDDDPPPVGSRVGIDLAPVDVRDAGACRWLEACIWPRVPDRADRLRAALELARETPPRLVRGDVFRDLPALVDAVPAEVLPVVVSTWVLAYFSKDERARFGQLLDDLAAARDLAFVSAEYPSIAPHIDRPGRGPTGDPSRGATLVGLTSWRSGVRTAAPVAWTQAHGGWLDWLDPGTAGPA